MSRTDTSQAQESGPDEQPRAEIDHGTIVLDREVTPSYANPAVVVNTPSTRIDEWYVPGRDGTVGRDNPEYAPSEPVVVVVYRDTLADHYSHYTGSRPLPLERLSAEGLKQYAFPASRLEPVGSVGPQQLPLDEITPSPYHARNFDAEANRGYIEQIRDWGHPKPYPLVRVTDSGFELINGHKRTWASHVAGLDEIRCWCLYVDCEEAARAWAKRHLHDYTGEQEATARQRLQDHLGITDL